MYLSFQYAMFLLAFFLLEVAVGVFLYMNRGQAEAITRKSLPTVFNDYSNKTDSRALVDEIQHDVSMRIGVGELQFNNSLPVASVRAVRCTRSFRFQTVIVYTRDDALIFCSCSSSNLIALLTFDRDDDEKKKQRGDNL